MFPLLLLFLLEPSRALFPGAAPEEGDLRHLYPIVTLALSIRDDAPHLPFLLGWMEGVEWPKKRLEERNMGTSKVVSQDERVTVRAQGSQGGHGERATAVVSRTKVHNKISNEK